MTAFSHSLAHCYEQWAQADKSLIDDHVKRWPQKQPNSHIGWYINISVHLALWMSRWVSPNIIHHHSTIADSFLRDSDPSEICWWHLMNFHWLEAGRLWNELNEAICFKNSTVSYSIYFIGKPAAVLHTASYGMEARLFAMAHTYQALLQAPIDNGNEAGRSPMRLQSREVFPFYLSHKEIGLRSLLAWSKQRSKSQKSWRHLPEPHRRMIAFKRKRMKSWNRGWAQTLWR